MNFGEFRTLVLNILKASADTTYPNALLYDAACGAQVAILPWVPCRKIATLTATASQDTFELPADCYSVETLQDVESGVIMERAVFQPGKTRNALSNSRSSGFDWIEYPAGSVFLSRPMDLGAQIRLYYIAHYDNPADADDDSFTLQVPRYAIIGMAYYAAAHAVLPSAVAAGQIGQFKQRIDSGTPTDNPMAELSRFFRQLFIEEMNRLPRYPGASK